MSATTTAVAYTNTPSAVAGCVCNYYCCSLYKHTFCCFGTRERSSLPALCVWQSNLRSYNSCILYVVTRDALPTAVPPEPPPESRSSRHASPVTSCICVPYYIALRRSRSFCAQPPFVCDYIHTLRAPLSRLQPPTSGALGALNQEDLCVPLRRRPSCFHWERPRVIVATATARDPTGKVAASATCGVAGGRP